MSPVSSFLIASLAGIAAAFPSMDAARGPVRANRMMERAVSASSSATSTAASSASTSHFPAWHPPQAGEVRGPCPALNALANHNICPRSGKGYTVPVLIDCLSRGLNIGADFATVIGTAGIGSNPNPLLLYFDLDMLDRHDAFIEHDASLSRADASTGDDHTFNSTIWNSVLSYYNGSGVATIPAAAKARYNRIVVEEKRDPKFTFGPTQLLFQAAETALYLSTMGNPVTGDAPVNYVRSLFEQERLPYELGWTPPAVPTTLVSLVAMVVEMIATTGEVLPDGLVLTEHTLSATFLGLDAITLDVSNAALYAVSKLTGAFDTLISIL